ncbi:Gx transporter family protein [Agathobaculum butyriciproducens]|uniref:Gx transporter family protein n=1 Tax=Agathobaculum butyriciproducens TaxID=1628085 RepID=UPI0036D43AAE
MLNKLKFGDFIIIGVVLVMAGALAAALTFHSSGDKLYAEVWQNDTLIERVQLTDATDRTIKLDGNTIVLAAHNIGQMAAAVIWLKNWAVIAYLPFLLVMSVPLGLVTGLTCSVVLHHLKKIDFSA